MSKFSQLTPEQIVETLNQNSDSIKELDFNSYQEVLLLEQAIKINPAIYFMMDAKNVNANMAENILAKYPLVFDELPNSAKTAKVKLALLEKHPEMVELFDLEDFDTETVKFLYTNYPDLLEDFEENNVQNKVNNIIRQLQKQGVQPLADTDEEE